jgi:hypothetical protein
MQVAFESAPGTIGGRDNPRPRCGELCARGRWRSRSRRCPRSPRPAPLCLVAGARVATSRRRPHPTGARPRLLAHPRAFPRYPLDPKPMCYNGIGATLRHQRQNPCSLALSTASRSSRRRADTNSDTSAGSTTAPLGDPFQRVDEVGHVGDPALEQITDAAPTGGRLHRMLNRTAEDRRSPCSGLLKLAGIAAVGLTGSDVGRQRG